MEAESEVKEEKVKEEKVKEEKVKEEKVKEEKVKEKVKEAEFLQLLHHCVGGNFTGFQGRY